MIGRKGSIMTSPQPDDPDEDRQWNNVLVLVAAIVIVAAACFVLWKLHQQEELQACLVTGRHDCAPIDIPDSH
jgi:hypothetical protein